MVLLCGVTSSGRTKIYMRLTKEALKERKQVLYLLPEIALTVQTTNKLGHVFGNKLGIYHSKYSGAKHVEIWRKRLSHHLHEVLLRARSVVFLPFQRLGLVIIDEEHETSFKQQGPSLRYHMRPAAIALAGIYGAKTLLGTTMPSMEGYYNACQGKYGLVTLTSRYRDIQLPKIRVVDTRDLQRRKMMTGPFSSPLIAAVNEVSQSRQQVILFQNQRDFAPMIKCHIYGWIPKYTNCDVPLTMHKSMNLLTCHCRSHTYRIPAVCPAYGGTDLRGHGFGTEKVEEYMGRLFPDAHIARMDLNTTRIRNVYGRVIDDFSSGRTNLLVGIQMVGKGLDFDWVGVVGILNADAILNYPDFRAYEHTFMMMAQVSGRAGHKGQWGEVFLQTKNKELPITRQVVESDYQGFYEALLEERRLFSYPPFHRLVYASLRHRHGDAVETVGIGTGSRLRQGLGERILDPDKPSIAYVKNLHIRKIIIKLGDGIDPKAVHLYLRTVQQQLLQDKRYTALQVYYNVDPM